MLSSADKIKRYVWLLAAIGGLGVVVYASWVFYIAHRNEDAVQAVTTSTQDITTHLYGAASLAQTFRETLTNAIALEDPDQLATARQVAGDLAIHLDKALSAETSLDKAADVRSLRTDFNSLYPEMVALAAKLIQDPDRASDLARALSVSNTRYDAILMRLRTLTQQYLHDDAKALEDIGRNMKNARHAGVLAALMSLSLIIAVAAYLSRTAVQAIRQGEKLKDEFLANTSHELRTPLHGIIGLSEALLHSRGLDQEQRSRLAMIVGSGKRLSRLINDILDFARLKQQGLEIFPESISARDYGDWVLQLSRPLLHDKPVELVNAIPEALPGVMADPARLEQILLNLVGNAIKFTRTGAITLTGEDKGEWILVGIRDTGIGIAPEHLKSIFESFNQGDGSTVREFGGTGLGLTVTRQLVELHGGRMQVTSTPGQGSTFTFSLPKSSQAVTRRPDHLLWTPASDSPPANTLAARPTPPSSGSATTDVVSNRSADRQDDLQHAATPTVPAVTTRRIVSNERRPARVLVVDDEPLNRDILGLHLKDDSMDIVTAEDGEKALALIESQGPFDLVLLDVMMPKLSGYDTCKRLRQTHDTGHLPVIFLTAKNRPEDVVQGFQAGGNDYLMKPFSRDELRARVQLHLSLHQALARISAHSDELEATVAERTRELIEAQKELVLREKMATLGVLSAGVAHEINNPNNFIFAANQTLEKRIQDFESFLLDLLSEEETEIREEFSKHFGRFRECAAIIEEGSHRITNIVKGLSTVTRLHESDKALMDVVEGLEKTILLIRSKYPDVEFVTDFRTRQQIVCWGGEMNQVFLNIIINACHAISKQAALVGDGQPGRITLSSELREQTLRLGFRDNGCGMSADTLQRIFDPFFTTKPVGEGTGLGLSLSRDIIRKHGGDIEVESTPGHGSYFEIVLPV
jgi:signal transduction histidine kinase